MRLILLLSVLALVALPAGLVAGCGSEDLDPVSVADAAAATREAESAKIRMSMEIEGAGLPQPVKLTAEGVTAITGLTMDVTFDFGPMLESFGAGAGGDGRTRIVAEGGDVFVDPPDLQGMELPDGASWVTADLAKLARAAGLDVGGLAEFMRITPQQQLDGLAAAGSVEKVGEEEIDGEPTTHLEGDVKFDDYLRALPAERRARLDRVIEQIAALPGGDQIRKDLNTPTPVELWVDGESRIRRMKQSSRLPAQQGVPAGSFAMTIDFSDFGTALDIERPGGGDVFDATDLLEQQIPG
jgi:hypothetical protein